MTNAVSDPWSAVTASVRGASHVRSDKPNQDAIASYSTANGAAIAVADGHGSSVCVRSDRGARLAVKAALDGVSPLLDGPDSALDLFMETMPPKLVAAWRSLVDDDLINAPLTNEELSLMHRADREFHPRLAYGTTLLVSIATRRLAAFLQLGDGDIVSVSPEGMVRRPLPVDPRLIGNETTSMSGEGATANFRVVVADLDEDPVDLIFMATDGYANSYAEDASFFHVVGDIKGNVDRVGIERVGRELPTWLEDVTNRGSGDDISTGLLHRRSSRSASAT